jgi:hypothetical protein
MCSCFSYKLNFFPLTEFLGLLFKINYFLSVDFEVPLGGFLASDGLLYS